MQNNLHAFLTWFVSPKSKGLEVLDGSHCVRMVAENIVLNYQTLFSNRAQNLNDRKLNIPGIVEEEYADQDQAYLNPVLRLKHFAEGKLRKYLSAFLLHGSLSTLDYSRGWSDFDTYLIINRQTLSDSSMLCELRERLLYAYSYLTEIDPFQHHGFLVCTDYDLQDYPSYYLPLEVMECAKSFLDDVEITINPKPYVRSEHLQRFCKHVEFFKRTWLSGTLKHHAYKGEYLQDNFLNRENAMYQMKNFLGFIMILPAYYLEAKGKPCYKRESFSLAKHDVPDVSWDLIEKASLIRTEWEKREAHPYMGNVIPDWIDNLLGKNYFESAYKLTKAFYGGLINKTY